jgi:glycosyltransferase involved in cell wall biosynthesis
VRILQVITDTDRRGAQVFATDLAAALERLGHDLQTVALAPGAGTVALDVEVLGERRLGAGTLRALRHRARAADVVVAHGSSTGPACRLALVGSGTPFVYRQISDSLFWAPTWARQWRVRQWMRGAAGVVALSDTAAAVLGEHFGIAPRRLSVVPNGVPRGDHHPASAAEVRAARAALDLPVEARVVGVLSALVPEKGVDLAVEAMRDLTEVHLVVAGDGPEREWLERRATATDGGRIHFVGSVADPGPVYAASEVIVLASRGGDSMPAVLIEAGFRGLPCVATDVGAIREVVDDGVTGAIVPAEAEAVAAAVRGVLDDRERAAQLGSAAEARCVARFEIEVVARAWEVALEEAVVGRPA